MFDKYGNGERMHSQHDAAQPKPKNKIMTTTTTTTTIKIEDLNSAGIKAQARKDGITEVTLLASGPTITIYLYGTVRVADTNADPVWEESVAGDDWQAMLDEEGIEL